MGSRIYDFLTDSFLFDESLIREELRRVPDAEIQKELQRYREFWFQFSFDNAKRRT